MYFKTGKVSGGFTTAFQLSEMIRVRPLLNPDSLAPKLQVIMMSGMELEYGATNDRNPTFVLHC